MLLGIDIGTTHVKALLLDPRSMQPVASAEREVVLDTPRPGWAEQHPGDWWTAAIAAIQTAMERAQLHPSAITGIGLSGQMHGAVCVNASGRAIAPAIIWADSRSADQVTALLNEVGPTEILRVAPGWPAPGYMGLTLLWLRQHKPDLLRQTDRVLLPKDYVRFYLTDELCTDPSDAAASWLFDVETGAWSERLMQWCRVEGHWLPPIVPSWESAGALTRRAAELLGGLRAGIPVAAGAADCAAQMLGHGVIDPGSVLSILGTGGQVVMPLDSPRRDPSLRANLYNHAAPDRWYAQAAILSGGLALRWLRDVLGLKRRPDAYDHLSNLAAEVPPSAEGLIFIPHLAGARPPQCESTSGAFLGLRLHHTPAHLARAVMEGVAFAMKECFDIVNALASPVTRDMEHYSQARPAWRAIASGGAISSLLWRQILANVYDQPLYSDPGEHHACTGAAILGGVASGAYASVSEACSHLPPPTNLIEPDPSIASLYHDQYAHYLDLSARLTEDPDARPQD